MDTPASLKIGPIPYVPFDSYPKDFTFIVNKEEFHTNKLIADLLSKKISKIHLTDPTADQYEIITKYPGDFQRVLDLLKVDNLNIKSSELPFFSEITNSLDIDINIKIQRTDKLTIDNVLDLIHEHEKFEEFYGNFLNEEIEFVSENFFKLKENHEDSLLSLSPATIQIILSSENLCLESEDQLLDFVNKLYVTDRTLAYFYDFVNFSNVGCDAIDRFASVFSIEDITSSTWNSIVNRLQNQSKTNRNTDGRYVKDRKDNDTKSSRTYSHKEETISTTALSSTGTFNGNVFDGIFNHLRHVNKINSSVKIKASSDGCGFDVRRITQYDKPDFSFYTRDMPNSWICFNFIGCMVSVTHYTIRTDKWNKVSGNHPRSWVIEGFNEGQWNVIDERINDESLNGAGVVHSFDTIRNTNGVYYKSIRMRLTDTNWNDKNYLMLNAIELYGNIQG